MISVFTVQIHPHGLTSTIPNRKGFTVAQQWHYRKDERRFGPVSSQRLRQLVASGELQPTDLVWTEGMKSWKQASRINGLFEASPPARAPVAASAPVPDDRARSLCREELRPPNAASPAASGAGKAAKFSGVAIGMMIVFLLNISRGCERRATEPVASTPEEAPQQPESAAADLPDAGDPSSDIASDGSSDEPVATADQSTPDFSKIDYEYDFASVDYHKIPPGATRPAISSPTPFVNRDGVGAQTWATEEGYTTADGTFMRHGKRTLWYEPEAKRKYREELWLDGRLHGLRREWSEDGTLVLEMPFVHGRIHGITRTYHASGSMNIESYNLNGKQHGPRAEWYPNGEKVLEAVYVDGKKHGPWIEWWHNGNPRVKEHYVAGERHGDFSEWTERGELAMQGQYKNGKAIGRWRFGFTPFGGGGMYYVDVIVGPWKGGTREQFIALLSGLLEGRFFAREGLAHGGGSQGAYQQFVEVFGAPSSDVPYVGPYSWQRVWTYACSDGPLRFNIASEAFFGIPSESAALNLRSVSNLPQWGD